MIGSFEDGGDVFSKYIEKCRVAQLMAVCYVYGRFVYNIFVLKGPSTDDMYINITKKCCWVVSGLYMSGISLLQLIDLY
jgi:hypothetical protein